MKNILLPIDFSCDVQQAVDFVINFVPKPYKLVFVNAYVCELDGVFKEFEYHISDDQLHLILATVSTDFQDKLSKMEIIKKKYSILCSVETKILFAKGMGVREAVSHYLKEQKFDMMVIGSKNPSSFFGYIFKSFAADMLSESKVPTTIIHHINHS
ncbi:hypothetical protein RF11_06520 [Thelohanellus kitauei]|uniref:UspA domain-containing protein n=1 Tax=Thelohanellus kitauei TaxID=669202 RepID=A0A0C2MJ77_THEKT|nr:hypothetical protein RF11_06520 [Thelohanellus kitauei]